MEFFINLVLLPGFDTIGAQTTTAQIPEGTWVHVFCSWNTNFADGLKIVNWWINGHQFATSISYVSDPAGPVDYDDTFTGNGPGPGEPNYADFTIPAPLLQSDNSNGAGTPDGYPPYNKAPLALADFQFWPDQYIDPATNIGKFIDSSGKPADPAVAQAAFGPSAILLSGDDSPTGFMKNKGTAGDVFTLEKTLQGSGLASAGAVSLPGAVAGQPVIRVGSVDNSSPQVFTNVSSDFETTISVDGQIQQTSGSLAGDDIFVTFGSGDLTNASTNPSN